MCFKQKDAISTQSGKHMKLVYQFIYLGSNISSTESDVNISLVKTWNAIGGSWNSDLSDKTKSDFF